jgi:hypothetical protein
VVATNGTPLQNGATSAIGDYVFLYPDGANGITYEFGVALESLQGTETAVISLGTTSTSNGIPSGAAIVLNSFNTPIVVAAYSTGNTKTVSFEVFFQINDHLGNLFATCPWLDHWQLEMGPWNGSGSGPDGNTVILATTKANQPLTGSVFIYAQVALQPNFSSGGKTYSYALQVRAVANDGSFLLYSDATMTWQHA